MHGPCLPGRVLQLVRKSDGGGMAEGSISLNFDYRMFDLLWSRRNSDLSNRLAKPARLAHEASEYINRYVYPR